MKILIATDGSEFSAAAVEAVCEMLAGRFDRAEVRIVSVYEFTLAGTELPVSLPEYYQQLVDEARRAAEESVENARKTIEERARDRTDVRTEVSMGIPPQVIIEIAEDWNAELIVVGSHGRGFWNRSLLGSVSDAIVHRAKCSVLVVRPPVPEPNV